MDWPKVARGVLKQVELKNGDPEVRNFAKAVGAAMDQIVGDWECLEAYGPAYYGRQFRAQRLGKKVNNRQIVVGVWLDTNTGGGVAAEALLDPKKWRRLR